MAKRTMRVYDVYWSPTGQKIATVEASTARAAKRKAPQPYRKYLGEIYVENRGEKKANPRIGTKFVNARVRRLPNGKLHIHILGSGRARARRRRR